MYKVETRPHLLHQLKPDPARERCESHNFGERSHGLGRKTSQMSRIPIAVLPVRPQ